MTWSSSTRSDFAVSGAQAFEAGGVLLTVTMVLTGTVASPGPAGPPRVEATLSGRPNRTGAPGPLNEALKLSPFLVVNERFAISCLFRYSMKSWMWNVWLICVTGPMLSLVLMSSSGVGAAPCLDGRSMNRENRGRFRLGAL